MERGNEGKGRMNRREDNGLEMGVGIITVGSVAVFAYAAWTAGHARVSGGRSG